MFKRLSLIQGGVKSSSSALELPQAALVLVMLIWLLVACRPTGLRLSLPHVSFDSVDIAPDGSWLVVSGMLSERATADPSDVQPYSFLPHRLWRYSVDSSDIRMLYFPLVDVARGQFSPSGYLAFYGTEQQTYIFAPEEIWFTTDLEMPPVKLNHIPREVVYWTWHSSQDVLLIGVNHSDSTFSISLYDPVEDSVIQEEWFGEYGEVGSFDLSCNGQYLVFTVNIDLCIFDFGTEELNCHHTPEHEYYPAWSPNGSKLAYTRCMGSNCELLIRSTDGGCQFEVAPGGKVAWQNEAVLWLVSDGDLYRIDLAAILGDSLEHGELVCP